MLENFTYVQDIYISALNNVKLGSIISFISTLLLIIIFKNVLLSRFEKFSKRTSFDFDDFLVDIIHQVNWPFYLLIPTYISLQYYKFSNDIEKWINSIFLITVLYYSIRIIKIIIQYIFRKALSNGENDDIDNQNVLSFIGVISSFLLWSLATIIFLQSIGFNITVLAGSLGIAGLAIAFAVQNLLEDIFAFFSIYIDQPFKVGELIRVNDKLGRVKRIGIKTTRLELLDGPELVVSNKDLTSGNIDNLGKIAKRRHLFNIGVTYNTPNDKLKKIPVIVENIIDEINDASFIEYAHTKLVNFGDFAIEFQILFNILVDNYDVYLNIRHDFLLRLKEEFEKEGIEFAFPSQTIYLQK